MASKNAHTPTDDGEGADRNKIVAMADDIDQIPRHIRNGAGNVPPAGNHEPKNVLEHDNDRATQSSSNEVASRQHHTSQSVDSKWLRTINCPSIMSRFFELNLSEEPLRHEANAAIIGGRVREREDMWKRKLEEEQWEEAFIEVDRTSVCAVRGYKQAKKHK